MKVSELVKILKGAGCWIEKHGKKHDIWKSPITGNRFSIPRHQSQETGTGLVKAAKKALLGEDS